MADVEYRRHLTGQFLIATPQMPDPRFAKSVIYVCAHTAEGAMGLVVNRPLSGLGYGDLLQQLGITPSADVNHMRVHVGGPMESGRGFVLHSTDYVREATLLVDDDVGLTATVDVLRAIAEGRGPRQSVLALGYAGWGAGQLDRELQSAGWLHVPSTTDLLFDTDLDAKWERAIACLGGAKVSMLSGEVGHA